jgi:hypothetical protein
VCWNKYDAVPSDLTAQIHRKSPRPKAQKKTKQAETGEFLPVTYLAQSVSKVNQAKPIQTRQRFQVSVSIYVLPLSSNLELSLEAQSSMTILTIPL